MRTSGRSAVVLASLSLVVFGAGCASQKQSSASPTDTSSPGTGPSYHAGEPCLGRSQALYAAEGLTCVTGRLERPSATRYGAGQSCSGRTESLYAASGLVCVQAA